MWWINTLNMATRNLPTHDNRPIQLTPNFTALARTRDTSISTSTEITLNADTTVIEVNAIDGNVFLKYGTDDVTNANFDEFIAAGSTRHYIKPTGVTAINLIDDADSAKVVVIEK